MDRLNELHSLVTKAKTDSERKEAVIALSKTLGLSIDAKIREDDMPAVGQMIHEASNWELTVLVGTQLNHIIECEPKYCKDLPKDLKFYKDHFKVYQVKHGQNYMNGIRIPKGDELFL